MAPLRVMVESGHAGLLNLGDVAMLQVAVARLRAIWPEAVIQVLTDAPDRLARFCPEAIPASHAGRRTWFAEREILGSRIHRALPAAASQRLIQARALLRRSRPSLLAALIRLGRRVRGQEAEEFEDFRQRFRESDLLLVCGQGTLTDHARNHALELLRLIEAALLDKKGTALVGQGIGPLTDAVVLRRGRAVLPSVDLIGLREGRGAAGLLPQLGLSAGRVVVTGDEAIEMAHARTPKLQGDAIGVSLRVSPHAGVGPDIAGRLRPVLHSCARARQAALVPLPINEVTDPPHVQALIDGYPDVREREGGLRSPQDVVEATGQCRVVVTGTYHAAVFALSQGIPVVCLARAPYFRDKFLGLADQFGRGCEVLSLDEPDLATRLEGAIDAAWRNAATLRGPLLEAAAKQVGAGYAVYGQLQALFEPGRAASVARVPAARWVAGSNGRESVSHAMARHG